MLFKRTPKIEDIKNVPVHIGVIMDGNGRWAKRRGLPRTAGHAVGVKTFETIAQFAADVGVKFMTVYAFSTENWSRPKDEIDAIMKLLEEYLDTGLDRLAGRDIRFRMIGDRSVFSETFRKKIAHLEEETAKNKALMLNVAINYGGRAEIVRAAKSLAQKVKDGEIAIDDITEKSFSDELYTAGQPEVDLVIRPSGEYRLSNFLTWQSAYSELWFDSILWPDFSEKDLLRAFEDYQKRNRRFGGV